MEERLTKKGTKDTYVGAGVLVDLTGKYMPKRKVGISELCCKLGVLEDIEQELGIGLVSLFDSKYTSTSFEMELEEDGTIYFDGDSFYGNYSAEQFLDLIKDMLSMYKQLIKLKRN